MQHIVVFSLPGISFPDISNLSTTTCYIMEGQGRTSEEIGETLTRCSLYPFTVQRFSTQESLLYQKNVIPTNDCTANKNLPQNYIS